MVFSFMGGAYFTEGSLDGGGGVNLTNGGSVIDPTNTINFV